MIYFIISAIYLIVNSALSRLHGSDQLQSIGKVLKGLIVGFVSVLPVVGVFLVVLNDFNFEWVGRENATNLFLMLLTVLTLTGLYALVKNTGHGQYFTLGKNPTYGNDRERIDVLIRWAEPYLSPYWYGVLGLATKGVLMGLVVGVVAPLMLITLVGGATAILPSLSFVGSCAILATIGCAVSHSVSYMIGWKLFDKGLLKHPNNATEIAEWINGFGLGLVNIMTVVAFIPYQLLF